MVEHTSGALGNPSHHDLRPYLIALVAVLVLIGLMLGYQIVVKPGIEAGKAKAAEIEHKREAAAAETRTESNSTSSAIAFVENWYKTKTDFDHALPRRCVELDFDRAWYWYNKADLAKIEEYRGRTGKDIEVMRIVMLEVDVPGTDKPTEFFHVLYKGYKDKDWQELFPY